MNQELRCGARLHAIQTGAHEIEVKCSSVFCGADRRTVVLHRFDLRTGLVRTLRFKKPETEGRGDDVCTAT